MHDLSCYNAIMKNISKHMPKDISSKMCLPIHRIKDSYNLRVLDSTLQVKQAQAKVKFIHQKKKKKKGKHVITDLAGFVLLNY